MNFELVSLEGVKFSASAYSVVLPTAAGQITVMGNHESLLSVVTPGVITIRRNQGDADNHLEHFGTFGGVLEISTDNKARVLVDEATHGDEINLAEAEKAHQNALAMLKSSKEQVDLDHAQALVDRHAVRLEVARLRHRHQRRS